MKRIVKDRKFLMGLAVSLVLAMAVAVGSFAIGEIQTPANPQVAATNDDSTGALDVTGGEYGQTNDYHFEGTTEQDGVLYIHPKSSETNITIKNKDPETETDDRIEITAGPDDTDNTVNITLAGVNINAGLVGVGSALKIKDNAQFNVNVTLADNSENYLTSGSAEAGLEKSDDKTTEADIAKLGTLTIGVPSDSTAKNGMLEANNGERGAGIGGNDNKNGSNITITGGVVTANGGNGGAGIGGGPYSNSIGNGRNIKITGGVVKATGGSQAAGIGGGRGGGDGSNITITGGVVTATGQQSGGNISAAGIGGGAPYGDGTDITITGGVVKAYTSEGADYNMDPSGIGGGFNGNASGNTISGNAVVMIARASTAVSAFKGCTVNNGITFTGVVKAFDPSSKETEVDWDANGEMTGNVTLSENLEIPVDLTIPAGQILSIKEEKEVTLSEATGAKWTVEGELQNNGTVTLPTNLEFGESGKVTTLLKYDKQGGSFSKDSDYQLYQDKAGKNKTYQELPQPATNDTFNGWFTKAAGAGNKIDDTTGVDLNLHKIYADMDYVVTFDSQGGSDVSPVSPIKYKGKVTKPASDPTREDYKFNGWYKEAECINKWDFDKDTVQGDTTLYAGWAEKEKHKITIDQPEGGSIELDKDEAKEGDEVSFTLTPDEGYELKEGSVTVIDKDGNEIQVTEKDGKYTFTMPDSEVTITAIFEQIPEPTPTPPTPTPPQPGPEPTPEPTPDPSVNPDGDGSGASSKTSDPFMGGVALLLLGVATTGAVLVRKRK